MPRGEGRCKAETYASAMHHFRIRTQQSEMAMHAKRSADQPAETVPLAGEERASVMPITKGGSVRL